MIFLSLLDKSLFFLKLWNHKIFLDSSSQHSLHRRPAYLPALARLLPKLNGVAEVVETPKFPILKFTAGLAVNPKPPKLNPLAVELAVSSPPNPDRRAGKETNRILKGERGKKKEEKESKIRIRRVCRRFHRSEQRQTLTLLQPELRKPRRRRGQEEGAGACSPAARS